VQSAQVATRRRANEDAKDKGRQEIYTLPGLPDAAQMHGGWQVHEGA
jgi:hypothetical protein